WAGTVSHPSVIAAGFAIPAVLWVRGGRGRAAISLEAAFVTLALVLLARCVLDTWDTGYYLFPALLALTAWGAIAPGARLPATALAATALAWLSFHWLPEHGSPDLQAAVFLAWSLPLAGFLSWRLAALVPRGAGTSAPTQPVRAARARSPRRGQETTVSSL